MPHLRPHVHHGAADAELHTEWRKTRVLPSRHSAFTTPPPPTARHRTHSEDAACCAMVCRMMLLRATVCHVLHVRPLRDGRALLTACCAAPQCCARRSASLLGTARCTVGGARRRQRTREASTSITAEYLQCGAAFVGCTVLGGVGLAQDASVSHGQAAPTLNMPCATHACTRHS